MKLYSATGSCSSASHIALLEAGVPFERVAVDLRGDRRLPDGRHLNDLNPKGYVPVLELDSGEVLTENVAILPYIADLNPASGLAPANGTLDRVRLHEWLGFISSEVHKTLGALFNPQLPEAVKPMLVERFLQRVGYIEQQLGERDYLLGARFSVADAYLYIVLNWCPMLGVELSGLPRVHAYQARIAARGSVQEALER